MAGRRRTQLKSNVSDDEVRGAKLHWEGLGIDERLAVLRFDDPLLVERVVEAQKELIRSDMRCFVLGIRGQDATDAQVGVGERFEIDCDATGTKPEAFVAKPELVQREDFFKQLEAELGSPFLKGRSMLQRRNWSVLFGRAPKSWAEFLERAFALVELAILDAFQSAQAAKLATKLSWKEELRETPEEAADWIDEVPEVVTGETKPRKGTKAAKLSWKEELRETPGKAKEQHVAGQDAKAKLSWKEELRETPANSPEAITPDEAEEFAVTAPEQPSKGAKRRARKKLAMLSGGGGEDDSVFGESAAQSVAESSAIVARASTFGSSLASAPTQLASGVVTCSGGDDDAASISSTATTRFITRPAENEEELQVDWSTAAPLQPGSPLETVEEDADVELEVDWSEKAEPAAETRWSVEMTDALTGVRAEWHWVSTPHPILTFGNVQAHTKNTFLCLVEAPPLPEELRLKRAKSVPAPRRRRSR